ncbi:toll/interleukin-1 receptor domain-containing protein [Lentzea sp. NPDC042327]|uniref:toll/interleukin-1 receptor domain-containing protein n=1 Tax=Lentzea sp. NPDC042327 TaxID=3154801 RepID=UPI0033DE7A97
MPLDIHPKVFLAYAHKDRQHADALQAGLEARNVTTSLTELTDAPVPDAIASSDYYVLLWSSHTPSREWATDTWIADFAAELTRRRAFLFIVRVDEEPLPLLTPRKHVDLVDAVERLVTAWRSDRKSALPVFPQPRPPVADGPTVAVSVRSHDLGITHVVMAPLHLTGEALHGAVHTALRLPEEQVSFDGTVAIRFSYQLLHQDSPIARDESTVDLTAVDLGIRVEWLGPEDALDVDQQRLLLIAAFRHLLP